MSNPTLEFTLAPEVEAATPTADAYAYARMLKKLLPPGKIWRLDAAGILSKVFLACGDELVRVEARGRDLLRESDPREAVELLAEYEADLGLVSTGTTTERQARVVAHILRRQRFRPADFQTTLASLLGQEPEDVVVVEQSRAFAISVGDDREIFRFFIYRDPALPGDYDIAAAQALVDRMKPSHTLGHVVITLDGVLCDDPDTVCDTDRLGV